MLTDNQILRRCHRILAHEGVRVSRYQGGYFVHTEDEPKQDGNLMWSIWSVIDLADHYRERQDEYRWEQQQREWEIRRERRAAQA